MEEKRGSTQKFLLNILNSKLVIVILFFTIFSLAVIVAGNVIVKDGSMNVENDLLVNGTLTAENINMNEVSEESLILAYNFNTENYYNSTLTLDSSANNYHGTVYNPAFSKSSGFNNGGNYIFDGYNDYIVADPKSNLNQTDILSAFVWINLNNAASSESTYIMGTRSGKTATGWFIDRNQNTNIVRCVGINQSGTYAILIAGTLTQYVWNHVGCIYNGSDIISYVNGVQTNYSNGQFNGTIKDGLTPFTIGSLYTYYSSSTFNGSIDDIRVYNKTLTAQEVSNLYNSKKEVYNSYVSQKDLLVSSSSLTTSKNINLLGWLGIGTSNPSYPIHVFGNGSGNISAWFQNNISSSGYITRTSVYAPKDGKNASDWIQNSNYYLSDGEINHPKFYGYVGYDTTDFSRPEESCASNDEDIETCVTNYPYTKLEEGVSLDEEINVLRQSLYDTQCELCSYDNKYSWCGKCD